MEFFLFCALLLVLFLLSQMTTKFLSRFLISIFHSHTTTIHVLAFLFLPGVVLHEFSHLIIANILFVPTGEVEFFPEIHGNQVKMGSVAIARTDPLRRFLIGVAPVIGGIGVILLVSQFVSPVIASWQNGAILYCIFEIANTMFSSSKDMEGALGFVLGAVSISIVLQILGVPVVAFLVQFFQKDFVGHFFTQINSFLFIALGLDVIIALIVPGAFSVLRRH